MTRDDFLHRPRGQSTGERSAEGRIEETWAGFEDQIVHDEGNRVRTGAGKELTRRAIAIDAGSIATEGNGKGLREVCGGGDDSIMDLGPRKREQGRWLVGLSAAATSKAKWVRKVPRVRPPRTPGHPQDIGEFH